MRTLLQVAMVLLLSSGSAFAQSSKAAAAINTVTVCANNSTAACSDARTGTGTWQAVMATTIKTSNVADLFIGTSLVTGLYTSTTVKGNGSGSTSTATAMGSVKVRILIDGKPAVAYPDTTGDGVIFDARIQTLTANLGYIFSDCFASGGTTGTGCTLTPEQISLALETSSAHSFNFIALNVGTGLHTLEVQAMVNASGSGTNGGSFVSNALFGLGSLTVEAARMVNSFSF
ncbi:MAG TPA: hypothetical protein VGK67_40880 [Myxococcales bacterium]